MNKIDLFLSGYKKANLFMQKHLYLTELIVEAYSYYF